MKEEKINKDGKDSSDKYREMNSHYDFAVRLFGLDPSSEGGGI